ATATCCACGCTRRAAARRSRSAARRRSPPPLDLARAGRQDRPMRALAVLGAVLAALGLAAPAAAAPPPLPASMAALGDSITVAVDSCCFLGSHPERSWSTGGLAGDGIRSQYERLAAANPALVGHATNLAVPGAVAADARAQADRAVALRAQYVTVL